MPKCDFNKVKITLWHGCSPVNFLHIFGTPFPKNTIRWLLLLHKNDVQKHSKIDRVKKDRASSNTP